MTALGDGWKWNQIEANLARDGYFLEFTCNYHYPAPADVGYTGREKSGWEIRRKIKAWCLKQGIRDYKILRNGGYVRDLNGIVYELYVRRQEPSA